MALELYGAIKKAKELHHSLYTCSFLVWANEYTQLQIALNKFALRHRFVILIFLIQTLMQLVALFLATTFNLPSLELYSSMCM